MLVKMSDVKMNTTQKQKKVIQTECLVCVSQILKIELNKYDLIYNIKCCFISVYKSSYSLTSNNKFGGSFKCTTGKGGNAADIGSCIFHF